MAENDTDADIARLTRERDEAMERERLARLVAEQQQERAAGLSRELLAAIQARDSYRASAEARVGMRREFEELLGCGDTMGEEAFERGLARLRGLVAAEKELAEFSEILSRHNHEWSERCELAESRAERLDAALREIADECDCDFPRCQSTIARAALQEEGK